MKRTYVDGHENETREIEIPPDKVGLIIGSKGSTIKRLKRDAANRGARLELKNSGRRGEARVVIRANSVDNADFLEQEVTRIACLIHENETREIEIPSDKVGLIIGSRGATIKGLQLDAKKHGAHLELMQSELQGRHPARVVIKANSSVVADLLEAEVIRTARLIEPDDASTLSAAATAENRRTSWRPSWKDPSFGIVPWTKVGERFYCLVQV